MDPIFIEVLGALVRWGLTGLTGYLVTHHVLTSDQSDRFANAVIEHVLLWLPALGAISWSVWKILQNRLKVNIALGLPSGSTNAAVSQEMRVATMNDTLSGVPPK